MLRQRMYNLVMGNLSPIQQVIQAYHAGMEYMLEYGDTEEFEQWSKYDKTVIILNGGTSNRHGYTEYAEQVVIQEFGSMEKYGDELKKMNIPIGYFYEPDLNNATSAIAFLVDETVWDKEKYPDPLVENKDLFEQELTKMYGEKIAFLRIFLKSFKLA